MPFVDYGRVLENSDVVFTQEQIQEALAAMGRAITAELSTKDPLVLTVMMGGSKTAEALKSHLKFSHEQGYVQTSRYNKETTGGKLSIKGMSHDEADIQGRVVLLVDDIIDGGITAAELTQYFSALGASEVYFAALIDKVPGRVPGGLPQAHFTGLSLHKNLFLIGFGLDCKKRMRELDSIIALRPGFEFTPDVDIEAPAPASAAGSAAEEVTGTASAPSTVRELVLHAATIGGAPDVTAQAVVAATADDARRLAPGVV